MNLIDFHKKFPNEDACVEYFKAKRESQGIVCDKCGCIHHYWKSYRNQWQCKKCGHRIGLKAGAVMHSSKLPYYFNQKVFFSSRTAKTAGYLLLSDCMGDAS